MVTHRIDITLPGYEPAGEDFEISGVETKDFHYNLIPTEIILDADFDSGNAGMVTPNPPTEFNLWQIEDSEGANNSSWLNFKLTGSLNITINLVNATGNGEFTSGSNSYYSPKQMVYACNGSRDWKHFPVSECSYSGGMYSITHTFECNDVQIATYYPYSYTDAMNYIENVVSRIGSGSAQVSTLGLASPLEWSKGNYQTGEQLPVKMLELTNFSIPENNKRHIFIIGRNHPNETLATWMTEGLIEHILANQNYLDNFHWYWVPIVNVEGVIQGSSRNTVYGNSNRQWPDNLTQSGGTSEVRAIMAKMREIDDNYNVDLFIDWHGWAAGRDCSYAYGRISGMREKTRTIVEGAPYNLTGVDNMIAFVSGSSNCSDIYAGLFLEADQKDMELQRLALGVSTGYAGALGISPRLTIEEAQHNPNWTVQMTFDFGAAVAESIYEYYFP